MYKYKKQKLVYGVGINDADYPVCPIGKDGKQRMCKYYSIWKAMIQRCYSPSKQVQCPSYIGCTVCDDWKYFSKFKAWMEQEDWQGKELDKDLLVPGNKVYSPELCIFISSRLNCFIKDFSYIKKDTPVGVTFSNKAKKYQAQISNGQGKVLFLGYYNTAEEAQDVWIKSKIKLAEQLAEEQTDVRISLCIRSRLYGKT